ncbi:MAG: hypothetical protein IJ141_10700 [Lachnospiraceae bacterium]|nr:hypothetical protein [Lachnospiraceae bacterium]
MSEKKKKSMYKSICDKLGFEPYKVKEQEGSHEDDNWENPFAVLSFDEIDFLHDNKLFTKGLV